MSIPEINIGDLVEGARSDSETWFPARIRVDRVPRVEQQCHTILSGEGVEVSVKDSTLKVIATNEELNEAFELGRSRGWEHANFVTAYGTEHARRRADTPAGYQPVDDYWGDGKEHRWAENDKRAEQRKEFDRGWKEGAKNFRYGRYPDGEKIPD